MKWKDRTLYIIDQRKLPLEEIYVPCKNYEEVARAIKNVIVRGATAIGATVAFGYVLRAIEFSGKHGDFPYFKLDMENVRETPTKTRSTAVNLFWALVRITMKDMETNEAMGRNSPKLIEDGNAILTHCNTGALTTADSSTDPGAIRTAHEREKKIRLTHLTSRITSPSRLSSWKRGSYIPHTRKA